VIRRLASPVHDGICAFGCQGTVDSIVVGLTASTGLPYRSFDAFVLILGLVAAAGYAVTFVRRTAWIAFSGVSIPGLQDSTG